MKLQAYSIHDQKSGKFHLPIYKHTHGEAEREFKSIVNDDKSTLNKYPTDFDLYHIGEYDDNSGKFAPLDTPYHLVKAIQLVENQRPN